MTDHDQFPGSGETEADPDLDIDIGIDEELDLDAELDLDSELDGDAGLLALRLRELLAPEGDLGRQTTHQVDRTLRARSTMATGMDLLGLGWLTMRELLTDEPTRADGECEGT